MKNIVTENYLAIISNKNGSHVLTNVNEFYSEESPLKIIENSCLYYGSSLKGRIEGTNSLIGVNYKSPIIISEDKNIIAFPTCSYKNQTCSWIFLNNIDKYYYNDDNNVAIIFKNNKIINLNMSLGSLDKQILRASRLQNVLNGRKK